MLPTRSLLPLYAALLIAPCAAAQAPAVTGHWLGALDVVHADLSVEPGPAYLSFSQNGSTVSGTAGDSPAHQSPIASGKIDGNHLTFDVPAGPGKLVHFDFTLAANHLHGSATGLPVEEGSTIVVDAQPADETWQTPAPVTHVPDQLFATIAALDKKLFDAYNTCDLATMGSLVTDDLEFYHDKTGLAVGKQVFLDSIHNNICNKVQRQLIPGTMEVHRLAHFGAVEIGAHRFYHPNNPSDGVGEAKFITIWRLQNGTWQITREISYDHAAADLAPPQTERP